MADRGDAEIKIAFTAEAEDAEAQFGRMNELVSQLSSKVQEAVRSLEAVGEQAFSAAEAVQIMQERAARTGHADVVQSVDNAFFGGANKAAALDERYGKLASSLGKLGERVAEVSQQFQAGNLTLGQAEASLSKLGTQAGKAQGAVASFAGSVQDALGDLERAEGLDNLLASYNQVTGQMDGLGRHARDLKGELEATVQGLAGQKAALDASAPGFEQQSAKLAQAMQGYEGYINKLNALVAKMADVDTRVSAAVQEAVNGKGNSASAEGALQKAQGDLEALAQTLETVGNRAALADQKRAASAEAAAEKSAAARQKEAAAAQAAAAAEAERSEREAYAMQLASMNKRQLIEETERLSKARMEAAKAGDGQMYNRLGVQLGQSRTAMRTLNTELNLSKIKWMQQAQTAQMLGAQIGAMCEAAANLGDSARAGELDLMAFANGLVSVGIGIKAALGPLGLALMAVQLLQMAVNAYVKSENEKREAMRRAREETRKNAQAHREGVKALEDYNAQQEREAKQQQLEGYYKRLNKELEERKRKISEITQAELRNRALKEDAEDHAMTMRQLQLEQDLASGMVTQAQYAREMLELEKQRAKVAAGRAVAAAQGKYDELVMQQKLNQEDIQDKLDVVRQVYQRGRGSEGEALFGMSPEEVHLVYENFINKYLSKLADAQLAGDGEQADYFESLIKELKARYLSGVARYSDEGEYTARYKAQKAQEELADAQLRAAMEERERLAQEKAKAGAELEAEEARAAQEGAQAEELHRQKLSNLQAKEEAEGRQKARQARLEKLEQEVSTLEGKELEARRKEAQKKARQSGNALTSQYYGQRASVYRQELQRRAAARQEFRQLGYTSQNGYSAGEERSYMQMKLLLQTLQSQKGNVNAQQLVQVMDAVNDALKTRNTEDDKLAQEMLQGLNASAIVVQQNTAKLRALQAKVDRAVSAIARNSI